MSATFPLSARRHSLFADLRKATGLDLAAALSVLLNTAGVVLLGLVLSSAPSSGRSFARPDPASTAPSCPPG